MIRILSKDNILRAEIFGNEDKIIRQINAYGFPNRQAKELGILIWEATFDVVFNRGNVRVYIWAGDLIIYDPK